MPVCMTVLSGTGSGIGTYILNLLQDEYPEIFRLVIFAGVCCTTVHHHVLSVCEMKMLDVNVIYYSVFFC